MEEYRCPGRTVSRNRRNRIVERIEVLVVVNLHHMNLALNISLLQSRNRYVVIPDNLYILRPLPYQHTPRLNNMLQIFQAMSRYLMMRITWIIRRQLTVVKSYISWQLFLYKPIRRNTKIIKTPKLKYYNTFGKFSFRKNN